MEQRSHLTALDLWLIHVVYEVVAAESTCVRCGTPLDRRVRVVPSVTDDSPLGAASVVTRCRGWRRHRHTAVVGDGADGLLLGPLHAVGAGRHVMEER
jgi:hypothetical protein